MLQAAGLAIGLDPAVRLWRRRVCALGARRGDVVVIKSGLAFVLAFLIFPAEAAKQSSAPNRYGAIAYHRASQAWGVSFDHARARDAALEALKQCGNRKCEVVHRFKNGCAALAEGPNKAVTASGATRDEAETKAMRICGGPKGDSRCRALAWACTR